MKRDELRQIVSCGYDQVVDTYVERFFHELDAQPFDRELLDDFAARVGTQQTVCEVGCGPAQISRYLSERGVHMRAIDLSPEMVARARDLNPGLTVDQGDMLALDVEAGAWGGIVAFYSIIHLLRADVPIALAEFARALAAQGSLLVSFHVGEGIVEVDDLLDQPVRMCATLFTAEEMSGLIEAAGFTLVDMRSRPAYDFEYDSERVYISARKSG